MLFRGTVKREDLPEMYREGLFHRKSHAVVDAAAEEEAERVRIKESERAALLRRSRPPLVTVEQEVDGPWTGYLLCFNGLPVSWAFLHADEPRGTSTERIQRLCAQWQGGPRWVPNDDGEQEGR